MPAHSVIRFALLLLGLCLAGPSEALYTIKPVPGTRQLEVTLRLPPGASPRLAIRGSRWGLREQVESPRCGEQALARDGQGDWAVPPGCREVSWRVTPDAVEDGKTDASQQASLSFRSPEWTLLSEPTSRLRPVDGAEADLLESSLRISGATAMPSARWMLPAANKAPEFFALGDFSESLVEIGRQKIRYVIDDPERFARTGLQALHEQALAYLDQRLPAPAELSAEQRTLLVIWIGLAADSAQIGGAAGAHSFVANYAIPDGKNTSARRAETLMTLAHEQFHQLAEQIRGSRPPLPAWLNESIAHYYALKTLKAILPGPETDKLLAHFIDSERIIADGLLALEKRNAAHDPSAYPQIYRQGASFWAEFDDALQKGRPGRSGLDPLLVDLLTAQIPNDGSLPPAFIAKATAHGGARIAELIARYVGK